MKRITGRKLKWLILSAIILAAAVGIPVFAETFGKAARFRTATVIEISPESGADISVFRKEEKTQAYPGMRMYPGDRIVVGPSSVMYLQIDQDKVIRLGPDSEVVLTETLLGSKIRLTVMRGNVFFNVKRHLSDTESLIFVYGSLNISIRGTSGLFSAEGDTLDMMLFDGRVGIDAGGTEEVLQPGDRMSCSRTEPGSEKHTVTKTAFVLDDIPQSVVEEMKADSALKDRIISSVPAEVQNGVPVYAKSSEVDLDGMHASDEEALKGSESKHSADENSGEQRDVLGEDSSSDSASGGSLNQSSFADHDSGTSGETEDNSGSGDNNSGSEDNGSDDNEFDMDS